MTKLREKETGLQGLRWSLVMSPNEYFYIRINGASISNT